MNQEMQPRVFVDGNPGCSWTATPGVRGRQPRVFVDGNPGCSWTATPGVRGRQQCDGVACGGWWRRRATDRRRGSSAGTAGIDPMEGYGPCSSKRFPGNAPGCSWTATLSLSWLRFPRTTAGIVRVEQGTLQGVGSNFCTARPARCSDGNLSAGVRPNGRCRNAPRRCSWHPDNHTLGRIRGADGSQTPNSRTRGGPRSAPGCSWTARPRVFRGRQRAGMCIKESLSVRCELLHVVRGRRIEGAPGVTPWHVQ